jgi:ATP-binding cassette, subfamily B, bacterial
MTPKKVSPIEFLRHLQQIFTFVWASHANFALSSISLQFVQGIFPVLSAWVGKQIFDQLGRSLGSENSQFLNLFLGLLLVQVCLNLASSGLMQATTYLNNELNRRLSLQTEEEAFRQILRLKGLASFENPKYHELFQMATFGLQMGTNQVVHTLISLVQNLVILLSFLGLVFFLNPLMLLVLLLANLPRLIQHLRFGQQRVHLRRDMNPKERHSFYFSQLLSNIYFAKEIRLFNIGNYFLENFLNLKRDIQKEQRKQEVREARANMGLSLLSTLVTTASFAWVIYQAYLGQISIGDVMLYTAALGSIGGAIEGIVRILTSVNEQVLFFQHYAEFQNLKPDLVLANPTKLVPALSKSIELKNISFKYSEDAPYILKNINLSIPAKQSLALVGLNGSGKTTLVKLLTRLYDPSEGQILWDGIDVREFDVDEYRQHIGAIFQDFVQYDLSARENIGLGDVTAIKDLAKVQNAALKTGMHQFINALPEQYETILSRWLAEQGEGVDLSGGQWQKIAISRMFMRESDFMIFDEPTAALDAKAEYEIFSQFAYLVANRTSLLISHRFSTVRMADTIAVLQDGEIIEYGSHHELMELNQHYKDLYSKQAMQYQ